MGRRLSAGTFFGKTAKALEIPGLRLTEKAYGPAASLPRHSHELAHICFVLEGGYDETIGTREEERLPSTVIYYPPDTEHAESHRASGRHFLVEVASAHLERLREYGPVSATSVSILGDSPAWLAARLYREFREGDDLSPLALEGITLELLADLSRRGRRAAEHPAERMAPGWLARVKDALRADLCEPPTLARLAAEVGVHPTHLARVFRRFERCTVSEYVRRLRVEYARRRMVDRSVPLAEVALSAGFADQAHFTRSFKRATGMTPSQFRELAGRPR